MMSRITTVFSCFIFLVGALFLPSLVLAGSATVTWQPNTETDLAKYRVYWSTTAGSYGTYKAEVAKGTTTHVANGLTEGQTYQFVVTAVDASGNESGFSSPPVSRTIPGGTTGVPAAPALGSPASGANVPGTSVTFTWQAAQGATDYNIKLYNSAGLVSFDRWLGNVLTYTIPGFSNTGSSFSWTITARNATGTGPAAAQRTFINGNSSTVPSAPALTSPSNGGSVPGTAVTFAWQASQGATDYNLKIYTSTGALAYDRWVGNALSYTVTGFSNTGRSFAWVITARNAAGTSPASARWSFVNGGSGGGTPGIPSAPALTSPSNGGSVPGTAVTFAWQASQGATDYNLKIYTSTGELAYDRWVGNALSYTVTGFSNTGRSFAWVITARNAAGTSPASARWSFVNGGSGGGTPGIPSAPALTSPSNGANASGTAVTFRWQPSQGATDYNLKIYTSTGALAYDRWVGNAQSYTVTGFSNTGRSFSWAITARNAAGTSPASAKWSFVNR